MTNSWIKVKVREYYEDGTRQCSTESRTVSGLMCPFCRKKFFPITDSVLKAKYCQACGKMLK